MWLPVCFLRLLSTHVLRPQQALIAEGTFFLLFRAIYEPGTELFIELRHVFA